jgi:hypothetical protein
MPIKKRKSQKRSIKRTSRRKSRKSRTTHVTENKPPASLFAFIDAQNMHRRYPESFKVVPTQGEIKKLEKGDIVKIFNKLERFWVIIKKFNNRKSDNPFKWTFRGEINNNLIWNDVYDNGDMVEFKGKHILAIYHD